MLAASSLLPLLFNLQVVGLRFSHAADPNHRDHLSPSRALFHHLGRDAADERQVGEASNHLLLGQLHKKDLKRTSPKLGKEDPKSHRPRSIPTSKHCHNHGG